MKQPPFDTLEDWLAWQETLHPSEIELGLGRVRQVAERMDVLQPAPFVVTVGGTNGKGSAVHMLSQALRRSGYRTATYTSPHILAYNERVTIDGACAGDADLCAAFSAVESARGATQLTYFEYGTLAVLWLIRRMRPDMAILEVGLGGRLDAVNIVDADLSLVTNVGLDHQGWLGSGRDSIGREKAGIFRAGRPAVYNDPKPEETVLAAARDIGCALHCLGEDYEYDVIAGYWRWRSSGRELKLSLPADTAGHQQENAAGVLMCLHLMAQGLSLDVETAAAGLFDSLPSGRNEWRRFQGGRGRFAVLLDVAHNREAALSLAAELQKSPVAGKKRGKTLAVFAALVDKPVEEIGRVLAPQVDAWHIAGLDVSRGMDAAATAERLAVAGIQAECHDSLSAAWRSAAGQAGPQDRVVVFGSFYTVQAVLQCIEMDERKDGRTANVR